MLKSCFALPMPKLQNSNPISQFLVNFQSLEICLQYKNWCGSELRISCPSWEPYGQSFKMVKPKAKITKMAFKTGLYNVALFTPALII